MLQNNATKGGISPAVNLSTRAHTYAARKTLAIYRWKCHVLVAEISSLEDWSDVYHRSSRKRDILPNFSSEDCKPRRVTASSATLRQVCPIYLRGEGGRARCRTSPVFLNTRISRYLAVPPLKYLVLFPI